MINRPSDVTNFNGLLQSAQAALNNEKDEMDPNVMDAAKELRALLSVSTVMIFKGRLLSLKNLRTIRGCLNNLGLVWSFGSCMSSRFKNFKFKLFIDIRI